MPINKFLYFGDFLTTPLAMILFFSLALWRGGAMALPVFGLAFVAGFLAWTLAEYLIHRFLYHHAPVLSPLHDAHHRSPAALIGVPSFVSSGLVILICYAPLRGFAPIFADGFTGGALLGYAGYMLVHHAVHHWKIEPGDWLYAARVRHMAHHYHDDVCFGVITGFWDRVFGTAGSRKGTWAAT